LKRAIDGGTGISRTAAKRSIVPRPVISVLSSASGSQGFNSGRFDPKVISTDIEPMTTEPMTTLSR
jgi:hypothetical protein